MRNATALPFYDQHAHFEQMQLCHTGKTFLGNSAEDPQVLAEKMNSPTYYSSATFSTSEIADASDIDLGRIFIDKIDTCWVETGFSLAIY